jgi:hypothetical protein
MLLSVHPRREKKVVFNLICKLASIFCVAVENFVEFCHETFFVLYAG